MPIKKLFHRHAIPHLTLILLCGQIVTYLLCKINPEMKEFFVLVPTLVLNGEVWRLFTFLVYPLASNPLGLLIGLIVYYIAGTHLEASWGMVRYNKFIFLNWLLTVTMSFFLPSEQYGNIFIFASVYLAFATYVPNYEFYLYFIIPVKVKWLGVITFTAFIVYMARGEIAAASGLIAYWIFCRRELSYRLNLHGKAIKPAKKKNPFHKCHQCGITEEDNHDMQFRVCSKCGEEFCAKHIKEHACKNVIAH